MKRRECNPLPQPHAFSALIIIGALDLKPLAGARFGMPLSDCLSALRYALMRHVPRIRLLIQYWLPLIVWMVLIFSASSDRASVQHSSRIIGPIVHWLFPSMPPDQVDQVVFLGRKCAHLMEFAVLGWLAWRLLRRPVRRDPRPWRWAEAGWALLWVLLYASSDEFHQWFVPSRQASVVDVLIDTCGGAAGLVMLWAWTALRARWRNPAQEQIQKPKPEVQSNPVLPTRPAGS